MTRLGVADRRQMRDSGEFSAAENAGVADTDASAATGTRRLRAIETAAATSVIVVCMVALAIMTGILPMGMLSPASADPVLSANGAAGMAGIEPTPVAEMAALTEIAPSAASSVTPQPDGATTEPIATPQLQPVLLEEGGVPAAPLRLVQSDRTSKPKMRRPARAVSRNTGPTTGKTRDQVIGELLRSKRDGTYPGDSEIYR